MGFAVAVALSRAGVKQGFFAAANDGPNGVGIMEIIQIAKDDEIHIGVGGEAGINLFAEDFGFLEAQIGFIGVGDGTAGLEMGGEERE